MTIDDKRLMIVYTVIFLWTCLGVTGAIAAASFVSLAVHFLSLTGFVGVYVWVESVRKSYKTSIFRKGPSSNREIISYVVMFLWAILGAYGILKHKPLDQLAAYYGALTPFVGAYILGDTYKNSAAAYNEIREATKPKFYNPDENPEEGSNEKENLNNS